MSHKINLVNKKFGRLKVVAECEKKGNSGQIRWGCLCDCGNSHIASGESLKKGKVKSCGCLKEEYVPKNKKKDRLKAILRYLYSSLVKRHKKKFTSEVIDFDYYCGIVTQKCFYCGLPYSLEVQDRSCFTKSKGLVSDTVAKINGVDRFDNNLGYVKGNVKPCCKFCNTAKNTMKSEEFYKWVKRVYEYNF